MDSVRQVWLLEHHTLGNSGRQIRQRSTLNHTLATTGSQESVRRNRRIQRALTKLYAITKGWLLRLEMALTGDPSQRASALLSARWQYHNREAFYDPVNVLARFFATL